ncbi:MAG: hypothetical protein AMXMBFR64_14340 [Myxococcales bacterium]
MNRLALAFSLVLAGCLSSSDSSPPASSPSASEPRAASGEKAAEEAPKPQGGSAGDWELPPEEPEPFATNVATVDGKSKAKEAPAAPAPPPVVVTTDGYLTEQKPMDLPATIGAGQHEVVLQVRREAEKKVQQEAEKASIIEKAPVNEEDESGAFGKRDEWDDDKDRGPRGERAQNQVEDGRYRTVDKGVAAGPRRNATMRGKDTGLEDLDQAEVTATEREETRPTSFLPRKLYFENTYLGGDAAFQERARRLDEALAEPLPHSRALGYVQPFDPPEDAGIGVTVDVDKRFLERPGRVLLQVGLQGSQRYGWRRPPLDVVLVIDGPAHNEDPEMAFAVASELLTQLGPQDHLGVIVSGQRPQVLAPLGRIRTLRGPLAQAFDALGTVAGSPDGALAGAMEMAGDLLGRAAEDRTTLPGTQTVLVVARGLDGGRVGPARQVAHALTLRGMVTSVIETGAGAGLWWEVNDAGYGNYHRLEGRDPREAVRTELEALSRVVARLVRVNVRLAPGVEAIRILGSRVLDQQEVAQVKAREVAADQHISRTLGVVADRGDDDDGLQTVIPYFYGGDSHVILLELWVDKPGPIADVTLRYKDMVNLGNATARASAAVRNLPREETREQLAVRKNARGFQVGEALEHASLRLGRGDLGGARSWLEQARAAAEASRVDREVVDAFLAVLDRGDLGWDTGRRSLVTQSLFVAARRKVGASAQRAINE